MCTDKPKEECGVFGVYCTEPANVAKMAYYGLYSLQHRGQEAAGISVCSQNVIVTKKGLGLVSEIFTGSKLAEFENGNIAIGHVRYSTTGSSDIENAQPVSVTHQGRHLALAHNGNLTNAAALRKKMEENGSIFSSTSDTETIAHIIAAQRMKTGSLPQAVANTAEIIEGAFSLVIASENMLICARDKNGFRPLCMGKDKNGNVVVASESCALDAVGAHFVKDIAPGEIVTVDKNGITANIQQCGKVQKSTCIFEYIYFARSDSVIDGTSVQLARIRAGKLLAQNSQVEADVVIGVPESGIDAAIGYSQQSKIPFATGFVKNKYIGRTFIAPNQADREKLLRIKLNPMEETIKGKSIVLMDDSLVRGTTTKRIVKLLRDVGAKEIHIRISSPKFLFPCYFGTDIDSKANLIACHYSTQEICQIVGADSLEFLSCQDLPYLISENGQSKDYCGACFNGNYPVKVDQMQSKNILG